MKWFLGIKGKGRCWKAGVPGGPVPWTAPPIGSGVRRFPARAPQHKGGVLPALLGGWATVPVGAFLRGLVPVCGPSAIPCRTTCWAPACPWIGGSAVHSQRPAPQSFSPRTCVGAVRTDASPQRLLRQHVGLPPCLLAHRAPAPLSLLACSLPLARGPVKWSSQRGIPYSRCSFPRASRASRLSCPDPILASAQLF